MNKVAELKGKHSSSDKEVREADRAVRDYENYAAKPENQAHREKAAALRARLDALVTGGPPAGSGGHYGGTGGPAGPGTPPSAPPPGSGPSGEGQPDKPISTPAAAQPAGGASPAGSEPSRAEHPPTEPAQETSPTHGGDLAEHPAARALAKQIADFGTALTGMETQFRQGRVPTVQEISEAEARLNRMEAAASAIGLAVPRSQQAHDTLAALKAGVELRNAMHALELLPAGAANANRRPAALCPSTYGHRRCDAPVL